MAVSIIGIWGTGVFNFVISVFSLCQGAMALKHVYDHDAFHAFLQRLDPKLCRTGMCMG